MSVIAKKITREDILKATRKAYLSMRKNPSRIRLTKSQVKKIKRDLRERYYNTCESCGRTL